MDSPSTSGLETTVRSLDGSFFDDSFNVSHEVVLTSTPIKKPQDRTPQEYLCDICGAEYKSQSGLRYHRASKHGIDVKQCSQCDMSFRRIEDLNDHMISHGQRLPYTCDNCQKTFQHLKSLRRHASGCGLTEAFRCKTCNKCRIV
ncbi:unnamed protein product [Owenia fusiformis]|uniref:C2H2-type domain-containing protein n=1 Tax=Owenia fusiformis TaxID=6347 RepID=A0A8J1TV87_OWEFU|nr:unnamed protein product [Owenia fusiformis]CAH1779023.1 unnamed protein product [Owenia fusiformis]